MLFWVKFVNKFTKSKEDEKKKEEKELSEEAEYLKEIVELLKEERLQDVKNNTNKDVNNQSVKQ